MKTKLTLLIGTAALVTLSFTFVSVETTKNSETKALAKTTVSTPVGGIMADEVVK